MVRYRQRGVLRAVLFLKITMGIVWLTTQSGTSKWYKESLFLHWEGRETLLWTLMMIMMMMNWFCGMVDRWKAFRLIYSRDHCQRSSPSRISDTLQAWFEPAQNLTSGLDEWSCAVVITTTPRRHEHGKHSSVPARWGATSLSVCYLPLLVITCLLICIFLGIKMK